MPHPAQASSAERSTFKMKRAQAPVFKTGFPAVAAADKIIVVIITIYY